MTGGTSIYDSDSKNNRWEAELLGKGNFVHIEKKKYY